MLRTLRRWQFADKLWRFCVLLLFGLAEFVWVDHFGKLDGGVRFQGDPEHRAFERR